MKKNKTAIGDRELSLPHLQKIVKIFDEEGDRTMYHLMNKDKCVADIIVSDGIIGKEYSIDKQYDTLPYAFESIEGWIEGRKASKHNRHLRELMAQCGCEKVEGYIQVTHAATLNDTFWIKTDKEDVTWQKISLYRNEFNETISKLAFEGIGLYGIQMSSTAPELTTSGMFRKCWKREGDEIYLYKRGSSGFANAGLEPYCEAMASEIAVLLCKSAISYDKVVLHGEVASKCKLFTSEEKGYVPCGYVNGKDINVNDLYRSYESIGSGNLFRRMLVLDALTFNTDRHLSNHGYLVNNNTQEIIEMAPIFDMNLSLLPQLMENN